MSKHQQKINEFGGIENFSKGIKNLVRDYKNAEKYLQEQKEKLETASEDEREAIETEIEETLSALEEGDEEIVRKIESYIKNKDGYEERMRAMRAKRDASYAEKGLPPVVYKEKEKKAPAAVVETPASAAVQTAVSNGESVITKAGGGETKILAAQPIVEEKKEEGLGNLIFWGALGFAGVLIGVNLFKNRN